MRPSWDLTSDQANVPGAEAQGEVAEGWPKEARPLTNWGLPLQLSACGMDQRGACVHAVHSRVKGLPGDGELRLSL